MKTIDVKTLAFLKLIAQNNTKEWFDLHKQMWESAKENYAEFAASLQDHILEVDSILVKDPKKYISRINRDVRFSTDKRPYKTFISSLYERGSSCNIPKFYLHIEPGNTHILAGLWAPEPEKLQSVRAKIQLEGDTLVSLTAQPYFIENFKELLGDAVTRAPSGFTNDSPYIGLIKMKQFYLRKDYHDDIVLSENFILQLVRDYIHVMPFLDFFSE